MVAARDNQERDGNQARAAAPFGLVLSGGLALGAYQAGALAALAATPRWPRQVAGTSVGALNAAIAIGGPVDGATDRLRRFWFRSADPDFGTARPGSAWSAARLLQAGPRAASALETLGFGRPGLFRPRLPPFSLFSPEAGHLSLDPLRVLLPELVDFDRLNDGTVRLCVTATDLGSGEQVPFDTARGDRIGPDEILACCAMPPLLAPVERNGRMLGDGGLTANMPLAEALRSGLPTLAIDLLPRPGVVPTSMSAGAARAASVAFASQTWTEIDGARERHALESRLALAGAGAAPRPVRLAMLHYAVEGEDEGMSRLLDYRSDMLERRWAAGARAAARALDRLDALPADGFVVEVVT